MMSSPANFPMQVPCRIVRLARVENAGQGEYCNYIPFPASFRCKLAATARRGDSDYRSCSVMPVSLCYEDTASREYVTSFYVTFKRARAPNASAYRYGLKYRSSTRSKRDLASSELSSLYAAALIGNARRKRERRSRLTAAIPIRRSISLKVIQRKSNLLSL